ncbi:MAG: transposase [Ruminococcaceae bacterium]|nr:transposase [Oscillospiraceae bacterium]
MIKECQDRCGWTYGYRRVHIWSMREKFLYLDPKTVLRVMNKYGLLSEIRRKRKYKVMAEQVLQSS